MVGGGIAITPVANTEYLYFTQFDKSGTNNLARNVCLEL